MLVEDAIMTASIESAAQTARRVSLRASAVLLGQPVGRRSVDIEDADQLRPWR